MRALLLSLLLLACPACRSSTDAAAEVGRDGDEIVVCGELFDTGVPVVLWFDPGGYSAYETRPRFSEDGPSGLRYRPGRAVDDPELRARIEAGGLGLAELQEVVDQFVLHYDACGTSRRCFEVLQDLRKLSVHFLLDVDGTIYQTLDLREQAWHARQANRRSVGVEIAQIGAYPASAAGSAAKLDAWYPRDANGVRLSLPEAMGDGGVRTAGFAGRPARPERLRGPINGREYVQHDFTPEQYESLVALTAALVRALPRIRVEVPRDAAGAVRSGALEDGEFEGFAGILGHYHVSSDKADPGPAFDWDRYLAAVRARLAAAATLASDS